MLPKPKIKHVLHVPKISNVHTDRQKVRLLAKCHAPEIPLIATPRRAIRAFPLEFLSDTFPRREALLAVTHHPAICGESASQSVCALHFPPKDIVNVPSNCADARLPDSCAGELPKNLPLCVQQVAKF